ncbi:hypothetical protein GF362_06950 [Candidatus Dojkabacteria bacterium]|nr:hypothetical protein [Candidatus Dojkabacteria bacterium]
MENLQANGISPQDIERTILEIRLRGCGGHSFQETYHQLLEEVQMYGGTKAPYATTVLGEAAIKLGNTADFHQALAHYPSLSRHIP